MSHAVHHPLFARRYARVSARLDARGAADHRRELLHTEAAIREAGFSVERCRRSAFKGGPVSAPHILGIARRR